MTVKEKTAYTISDGDGVSVTFPYGFEIESADEISVIYRTAAGVDATLLSSEYTVAGVGDDDGGTVTLLDLVPASGTKIICHASPALSQAETFPEGAGFPATTHTAAHDRRVLQMQAINEGVARALKQAFGDAALANLPLAPNRANKLLGFGPSGELLMYTPDVTAVAPTLASDISFTLPGSGMLTRTLQDRVEETYYLADGATPQAAVAAAYANGARLHVKAGETAYLECNPTAGDDIQAMANWMRGCTIEEGGDFYILLTDGVHTVETYIDCIGPKTPLDIRPSGSATELEITSISYALVSGSTYRATIGLGVALPAVATVGAPVGIQMPIGDEDARSACGGQIYETIAGDRLSFTYLFFSPNGAPTAPSSLTAGTTLSVTNNRVIVPKAGLRVISSGWGTGLQREGFLNCHNGGQAFLYDIGIAFVGVAGSNHDLVFATDTASRIYLETAVLAGAGDKVARTFQGAEIRSNNSCIGGAALADELYQGVGGGGISLVRNSLGGGRLRGVTAGAGCHVQAGDCLLAACNVGLLATGIGASISWPVSQISNCVTAVDQVVGDIQLDKDAKSLIERSLRGIRRSYGAGAIVTDPAGVNFSGNGTDDVIRVAHPGIAFGGTAEKNVLRTLNVDATPTPAWTAVENVDSATASAVKLTRLNGIARMSGEVVVDPTLGAGQLTRAGFSLPVASVLANARDVSGGGSVSQGGAGYGNAAVSIRGDVANARGELSFYAQGTTAVTITFWAEWRIA